jgi:hypothetical protein
MPKSLLGHLIHKYRESKCSSTVNSGIKNPDVSFSSAFYANLFLPKYAVLAGPTNCIPYSSTLYDKVKETFLAEVSNHPESYPQDTDANKYDTELKFQLLAASMANMLANKPHKPYEFMGNHFNLGHQIGIALVIGNGGFNIPVVDHFLHYGVMKELYKEVKTPSYTNADFGKALKKSFKIIRESNRADLETKYDGLNREFWEALSRGNGAAIQDQSRRQEIVRATDKENREYKAAELIDYDRINSKSYDQIYSTANSFSLTGTISRFSKKTDVRPEKMTKNAVVEWIKENAFSSRERLVDMFPKSGARFNAVDPFANTNQGEALATRAVEEESEKEKELNADFRPKTSIKAHDFSNENHHSAQQR